MLVKNFRTVFAGGGGGREDHREVPNVKVMFCSLGGVWITQVDEFGKTRTTVDFTLCV